ncbi:uncharacterized protein [Paramormyrops kingsleyae]|uniref:uncharacterized protein isoform X1 n=2 Tax=Paramormyrops kingsleyae TaxID=1676925 RepID=UPI003B976728
MCVDIVNISEWPTQMFQAIKKAFRRLRAALSKIKRRCIAAVKALRPEVCPLPIVTLGKDESASSPDEQDVDLSEWLEWDSCEVSSDEAHESVPGKSSVSSEGPGCDSDSSWSDDDGDDNSENAQLWESFRTDDPYNPLSFSSVVTSQATCTPKAGGTQVERLCDEEQRRPLQEEMPTTGRKKVTFSEKVKVRPLVAWAFASRVARDGSCWLQMARDRDRFRRRVEAASDVIGPVLLPQHRAAVWERLGRGSSTSSRHQYREDSENRHP